MAQHTLLAITACKVTMSAKLHSIKRYLEVLVPGAGGAALEALGAGAPAEGPGGLVLPRLAHVELVHQALYLQPIGLGQRLQGAGSPVWGHVHDALRPLMEVGWRLGVRAWAALLPSCVCIEPGHLGFVKWARQLVGYW